MMDNKTPNNRFNFTKHSIDALPLPASGRARYYDTETKGLCLYVYASGNRVFYFYGRVNGKPEDIKIGKYPDWTPTTARIKAKEIIGNAVKGLNPNEHKRTKRMELTLGEMFNEYLKLYAIPKKLKTIQDMKDNFDRYLGEVLDVAPKKHGVKRVKPTGSVNWSNKKLSDISSEKVQILFTDLTENCGNATANRTVELLSAIFNFAVKVKKFKGANPCKGLSKHESQQRDRFIQSDELSRFFEAVAGEPNESIRDYILLSLLTGARKANVLAMKWEHINMSRATWFLPDTKNGSSQTIPLTVAALEILQRRLISKASDFVFAGSGATGHLTTPKRAWGKILANAKLTDLTLHDLRRTLGSWQAATGTSLIVIGKTLNHKKIDTTAIYARLSLDPVRDSMETAQKAILAAGGITPRAEVLEFKKSNG